MQVHSASSIRRLDTAVSSSTETGQNNRQAKQDAERPPDPNDVELQLSDEVQSVPKHQQANRVGQSAEDMTTEEPQRPDDGRLDLTA